MADIEKSKREYGIEVVKNIPESKYDAVIYAVSHKSFESLDVKSFIKSNGVIYDVKGVLPREIVDSRL